MVAFAIVGACGPGIRQFGRNCFDGHRVCTARIASTVRIESSVADAVNQCATAMRLHEPESVHAVLPDPMIDVCLGAQCLSGPPEPETL